MARTKGATNKPKLVSWNGTKRDPAAYVSRIMLDETLDHELRLKAALGLLPYVHRKQPMEVVADINAAVKVTAIERTIIRS